MLRHSGLDRVNIACTSGLTAIGWREMIERRLRTHSCSAWSSPTGSPGRILALGLLSRPSRPATARDGLYSVKGSRRSSPIGAWRIAAAKNRSVGFTAPRERESHRAGDGRAFRPAGPGDVDLLVAGGRQSPATPRRAPCEGARAAALVSFKGAIGHTLGASGSTELALLLDAMRGRVPPTGFPHLDPELGLEPRRRRPLGRRVLFNLAGFGGHVACLALEKMIAPPLRCFASRPMRWPRARANASAASCAGPAASRSSACSAHRRASIRRQREPPSACSGPPATARSQLPAQRCRRQRAASP
jgi:hypothetical protein